MKRHGSWMTGEGRSKVESRRRVRPGPIHRLTSAIADLPSLPPVCALVLLLAAASAPAAQPFRVPEGFTVERAVSESALKFPMFACFDDAGRLYVAESSGLDLYEELRKQTRQCRITV